MAPTMLGLATFATLLLSVSCQVTGTYPIQISAPTPVGTAGRDLANYPQCAQTCDASITICRPEDLPGCECGPLNRGNASSCEVLTCSDDEYLRAETLSRDLCQPVYDANPALSVAASSAIASATQAARSALATRNPAVLTDYPPCVQQCASISQSVCMGNAECTCRCPAVQDMEGSCELASCSRADLDISSLLVFELCEPVGGLYPKIQSACQSGNSTSSGATDANGTIISPPITPFTGQGSITGAASVGLLMSLVAGPIMGLLF